MTVSSIYGADGPYIADGERAAFPRGFYIATSSELRVWHVIGSEALPVASGWTDSDPGAQSGVVTFDVPPAEGEIWFTRVTDQTQDTDYVTQAAVHPAVVEQDFDQITRRVQELSTDVSRAALVAPHLLSSDVPPGSYLRMSHDGYLVGGGKWSPPNSPHSPNTPTCLLYTSDAADE